MIKYEVGQPFPFPHPMQGAEVTLAEITTGFFDLKCYLRQVQPDEIKDWRKAPLRYGMFEYDKCVFFIIAFPTWSLEVSINVLKIKTEEQRDQWLNTEGNVINLFLIDAPTNTLLAMRTISVNIDFSEQLRDVLERQAQNFDSAAAVERKIAEIQHTLSTEYMISKITFCSL